MPALVISPLTCIMSNETNVELCYVKVLSIEPKSHKNGVYKKITVVQELGFWHTQFSFNLFPSHPKYLEMQRHLKLFIKVCFLFKVFFHLLQCYYTITITDSNHIQILFFNFKTMLPPGYSILKKIPKPTRCLTL